MTRWRSLFVTGVVLVGLMLVGAQSASAQGAIADVRVTMGTGTGSVDVTWTISTPLLTGDMIELEHREYSATQGANVGWGGRVELGLTAVKHTLTGLDHTKMYEARVRIVAAVDGNPTAWIVSADDGTTDGVDEGMATPRAPTLPVRVASPAVTALDAMLAVEWLAPASELPITLYRVYYTPKGGTTMEKIVLAPDTSTTVTSLMNGTEYTIEVAAESSAGLGPKSAKVMGTPKEGAGTGDGDGDGDGDDMTLAMPKISEVMAGDGQITVKWGMVEGATKYEARAVAGGSTMLMSTTEMSATFMNLTNGMKYMVSVRAGNADGYGEWSDAMEATPMMPTPALPLFGALALGAGLVAAGRARLRRRRALQAARVRGQFGR